MAKTVAIGVDRKMVTDLNNLYVASITNALHQKVKGKTFNPTIYNSHIGQRYTHLRTFIFLILCQTIIHYRYVFHSLH